MQKPLVTARWWQQNLLKWHDQHGRQGLPWKDPTTPYAVWVSEIMLQQTQVATVIPYFNNFMAQLPDIAALAKAPLETVLRLWAGLGYYARARNLHKSAQIIMQQHGGIFPSELEKVTALPGIGLSTAGAILAQSFSIPHPILDGNVKRVLMRFYALPGVPDDPNIKKTLWEFSRSFTPKARVAQYTQAIMDLGATLCTRKKPACTICPVQKKCQAFLTQSQEDYPAAKKQAVKPIKRLRFLFIEKNNCFLLIQRPLAGIWGGLWSVPECPLNKKVENVCQEIGIKICEIKTASYSRHSFTHFHLEYQPILIKSKTISKTRLASPAYAWYKLETICDLGLPAPIYRFFHNLQLERAQ
ncbi:MAG TPA: A/G-specific adenine glycosylase [Gammaproteobacteria bacterium]|nr:A/G-specific adenine glycosylase [Gammaproteobacteria bacterium]